MDSERFKTKYHEDTAKRYEDLRKNTPQWIREQQIVEDFLSGFPPGTAVLDIPVGTGRFLDAFAVSGFAVTGIDISTTMLAMAQAKVESKSLDVRLQTGDINSLDFPDNTFELVICLRFMEWVKRSPFESALAELARVARDAIIVSINTHVSVLAIRPLSFAGFLRLLRQWKLRFYTWKRKTAGTIHDKSKVDKLFGQLGLEVADRACVTDLGDYKRHGCRRDMYLLRK